MTSLALADAVLGTLAEQGVRVPERLRLPLRQALADRLTEMVPALPRGNPAGSPAVPTEYEVTPGGLVPVRDRGVAPSLPALRPSADERGTALSTRRSDSDPSITEEQRAAFEKGELVLLPITVPGRFGETTQALVPVAPRDLRAGIEAARQGLDDIRGRIASRMGDMPPVPERAMWRAHLDSGYLAIWFEDLNRWRRAVLEEFVAPTGRRR